MSSITEQRLQPGRRREVDEWLELVAAGSRQKDIAESLGMAKSVISEVVTRKAWRHL